MTGAFKKFLVEFGRPPQWQARAPGRINIIGEHTDYVAGLSLPAAIDRHCEVLAAVSDVPQLRVYLADQKQRLVWNRDQLLGLAARPRRLPAPQCYVVGAAAGLRPSCGLDLWVDGDLPQGVGLSSSAALTVALGLAMRQAWSSAAHGAAALQEELISWSQKVEQQYAGVSCGRLDQMAVVLGQAQQALYIDWDHNSWRPVSLAKLLKEHSWVAVHNGIARQLTEGDFSAKVARAQELLARVRSGQDVSDDPQWRHIASEELRVREALHCIASGDAPRLGQLLGQTHLSLSRDCQVSMPELDGLQTRLAMSAGCVGVRLMGGGFGGCLLALVENRAKAQLIECWSGWSPWVAELQIVDGARVRTVGEVP